MNERDPNTPDHSPSAVEWNAPGPGEWWPILDHMPKPVCRLFGELFPRMTVGWATGARRYGRPASQSQWTRINCWLYAGPAIPEQEDLAAIDAVAAETLATRRWRDEPRAWLEEERPAALAGNLALQAEPIDRLDDDALVDHLGRAIDHYVSVAPLHFSHQGFQYARGALLEACDAWGIAADDLLPLFAGASPATTAARDHIERIAAALRAAGVLTVRALDDIRGASPEAGAALDDYLRLHGHRLVENRDLVDPTLLERPDLVVTTVNAALAGTAFAAADAATEAATARTASDRVRERVPPADRDRFDALLDDARAAYGLGDDDEGVCFLWPLGLVRRAVLEGGRRLRERGRVVDATDLLDASSNEIIGLLRGAAEPSASELHRRAEERRAAAALVPPAPVRGAGTSSAGDAPVETETPDEAQPNIERLEQLASRRWSTEHPGPGGRLRGTGIGTAAYRGRACVVTDGVDALDRLQPGDVLVAVATNPGFNAVFPIVGAVVTEEGGAVCHAAVLARELGLPAVVGVGGIREIRDGDVVEVDPVAGVVRIASRSS